MCNAAEYSRGSEHLGGYIYARAWNGIKWVGVSGDLVERSGFVRHWPLPE